mmetsp:Transcript_19365/g.54164  ORF Transcript_19365/g.54164 Transcript_19365/m.54164 type:complete len:92 (+) Transcript_19365:492-767(+)
MEEHSHGQLPASAAYVRLLAKFVFYPPKSQSEAQQKPRKAGPDSSCALCLQRSPYKVKGLPISSFKTCFSTWGGARSILPPAPLISPRQPS